LDSILEKDVVQVHNAGGASSVVLVCEHASNTIPEAYGDLGLSAAERVSHVAWDPGAMAISQALSRILDAPLVAGKISRLIYDCNRPPEAADAMPIRSETIDIPGNLDLTKAERDARTRQVYRPFQKTLATTVAARKSPVIVTLHSFTPVYHGQYRAVEIGVLHDSDTRLADAMLSSRAAPIKYDIQRNQPYGPSEGVTHTLKEHGLAHGHLNVMLEVRNDLIETPVQQAGMAVILSDWVRMALAELPSKALTL